MPSPLCPSPLSQQAVPRAEPDGTESPASRLVRLRQRRELLGKQSQTVGRERAASAAAAAAAADAPCARDSEPASVSAAAAAGTGEAVSASVMNATPSRLKRLRSVLQRRASLSPASSPRSTLCVEAEPGSTSTSTSAGDTQDDDAGASTALASENHDAIRLVGCDEQDGQAVQKAPAGQDPEGEHALGSKDSTLGTLGTAAVGSDAGSTLDHRRRHASDAPTGTYPGTAMAGESVDGAAASVPGRRNHADGVDGGRGGDARGTQHRHDDNVHASTRTTRRRHSVAVFASNARGGGDQQHHQHHQQHQQHQQHQHLPSHSVRRSPHRRQPTPRHGAPQVVPANEDGEARRHRDVWFQYHDKRGRVFYYNKATGQKTWTRPPTTAVIRDARKARRASLATRRLSGSGTNDATATLMVATPIQRRPASTHPRRSSRLTPTSERRDAAGAAACVDHSIVGSEGGDDATGSAAEAESGSMQQPSAVKDQDRSGERDAATDASVGADSDGERDRDRHQGHNQDQDQDRVRSLSGIRDAEAFASVLQQAKSQLRRVEVDATARSRRPIRRRRHTLGASSAFLVCQSHVARVFSSTNRVCMCVSV